MTTKIIYHKVTDTTDCPDGLASAWIALRAMPGAEVIGWCYQSEGLPEVKKGDRLYLVDFSFPKSVLDQWAGQGAEIVVIDHHESAWNKLQGFSAGVLRFDMAKCGTSLTWEYFHPLLPMPAFIQYVQDRDLWNFELPYSEEVHEAVSHLRYKIRECDVLGFSAMDIYDRLAVLSQEDLITKLAPLGERLLAPKRERILAAAARWEWRELDGHKVPVVRLSKEEERLTSDVCSALYKQMPEVPFTACICVDEDGERWSLRSDKKGNNFDVGAVAVAHGGGGHRNAAGFKQI